MAIQLDSVKDGDEFPHRLVVIHGTCTTKDAKKLQAFVNGAKFGEPVHIIEDGRFKATVELTKHENSIELKPVGGDDNDVCKVKLEYKRPQNKYGKKVRLVYLVAGDHDGSFQQPKSYDEKNVDNSCESGVKRVETMGKIIQFALAEMLLRENILPVRATFDLMDDVVVYKAKKNMDQLHAMSGNELFDFFNKQLDKDLEYTDKSGYDIINIAVMSFTRFDSKDKKVKAHTALGGGNLGLFGGGSLYAWPEKTDEIPKAFYHIEGVPENEVFDDSHGRGKRWALNSTTIGAVLHELGHCLSLPHIRDIEANQTKMSIMIRGFDYLSRLFVCAESGKAFDRDDEPRWDRNAAVRLAFHPFIRPKSTFPKFSDPSLADRMSKVHLKEATDRAAANAKRQVEWYDEEKVEGGKKINVDGKTINLKDSPCTFYADEVDRMVVYSAAGIRHAGIYFGGEAAAHIEFLDDDPPKCIVYKKTDELRELIGEKSKDDKMTVYAMDNDAVMFKGSAK
eukprot:CAMPEP_0184693468 /NCGR_PEP_ID=MMETSP0313-20130426/1679_1 /TAXON_ID=2792 /ORGANISM="Porphyridium aerugineum, Strain SAG 1380-2" /LENGTH=507 /DNA_ID=CAMNT_0027151551 /DNA_START=185 /DNA_END=1708 /DNA_ORIENTATION=+